MTTYASDLVTNLAATPQVRNKSNKLGGRIRWFEATFTSPATGNPQIADVIQWGRLPVGARVIAPLSSMNCSAGTASCTLNIGDAASATRYLTATGVTSAGNTLLANPANGAASFETSDSSGTATDNCMVQSVVAGAAVATGQVITIRLAYVCD